MTDVLSDARDVIAGPRREAYGHPAVNHGCTAVLWAAYLERRFGVTVALDGEDVCWLNVLQKVSRQANTRQRDNLVDVAGFVGNIEMLDDHSFGGFTKPGAQG